MYIGQSGHIGSRLCPAKHPIYKKEIHDVYIYFVDDEKERKYLEGRLIAIMNPGENIRAGMRPGLSEELKNAYYDKIFN